MSLAFEPEPTAHLQQRYPDALARLFDQAAIIANPYDRPGIYRTNVFDHESGVRFIVSRERSLESRLICLHISASVDGGLPLGQQIHSERWEFARITDHLQHLLGEIASDSHLPARMKLVCVADSAIPHWEVEQES